jgi:hypothetical protein
MGEDGWTVAFDMFVEPDTAAGLGHPNRNLGSFTAILLGLPCHCRRTHTGTNGNSRPSSPRRIGAPPCHICLAFTSDRGVSRPLTQVSARGRRRRQARPTFFASESIPAMQHLGYQSDCASASSQLTFHPDHSMKAGLDKLRFSADRAHR